MQVEQDFMTGEQMREQNPEEYQMLGLDAFQKETDDEDVVIITEADDQEDMDKLTQENYMKNIIDIGDWNEDFKKLLQGLEEFEKDKDDDEDGGIKKKPTGPDGPKTGAGGGSGEAYMKDASNIITARRDAIRMVKAAEQAMGLSEETEKDNGGTKLMTRLDSPN